MKTKPTKRPAPARRPSSPGRSTHSAPADPVLRPGVKRAKSTRLPGEGRSPKLWQLRLYVMDQTPKSVTAFANLKKFCETHLKGCYRIAVIDLLAHPHLAKGDQVLAIPTVVRRLPRPVRTIIGTLSDTERVLVGLDLRSAA